MWNGFYTLNNITEIEDLRSLFKDAIQLSTHNHVDILKGFRREIYPELTSEEFINTKLTLQSHNVVINRKEYHKYFGYDAEVGSATDDNLFLFLYLSMESLNIIVQKYNLTKQQ